MLDFRALGIRGQGEDEHAPVVAFGEVEGRSQGFESEERGDRDRIRSQRRGGVEVGLGVGAHGRPDVSAFDVEDADDPRVTAGGEGVLEHGDPGRAEAFEERRLRFDRGHAARELRDHAQTELPHALSTRGQAPGVEEVVMRVDAHTQRSVFGHRRLQPVAEHQALQSWRLRTPNFLSLTTSSEVTAAANSARVVISGTEFAVAEARIS